MFLSRIKVKNFRLLKDFSIDLEEKMSLIIGKNNSGKTSLLYLLNQVLHWKENMGGIHLDDFNIEYKQSLVKMLASDETLDENSYIEDGVKLRLYIKYDEQDDLANVGLIMMDLDDDNDYVILGYDYVLPYDAYLRLREKANALAKKHSSTVKEEVERLMSQNIANYFILRKKSIAYNPATGELDEKNYLDLKNRPQFHEDALISIGYIDAKRQVANKESNKTLSMQTEKLFNYMETDDSEALDNFIQEISKSDNRLSSVYADMFKQILAKVEKMGGVKPQETKLKITSSLQQRDLLKGNTKVVYESSGEQLPEDHNGLGYMNLISMIFQIEIIRQGFLKGRNEKMADINLLIIEEPEAHTHPQMQYVFIKNIKSLVAAELKSHGLTRKIQSVITTHSSHIVAESDFKDIKYMRKNGNQVEARNLKDLQEAYQGEEAWYTFLKHYLTLNRSELFFADKAIFIEGDTERILLPVFMKKMDQEEKYADGSLDLCRQNISIIEVGAYSHIFGKFINFLGLEKVVVFTDLDICKKQGKGHAQKAKYEKGKKLITSNNALKEYFKSLKNKENGQLEIKALQNLSNSQKTFSWDQDKNDWAQNDKGTMMVCFQKEGNGYQGRTFEDNFFAINKNFLRRNLEKFLGLKTKNLKTFLNAANIDAAYDLADKGIESKATFAVDIIINSEKNGDKDFYGWNIPQYIKDGLLWIQK